MNGLAFSFQGETLWALPSGALHWPRAGLLCVSDLHLGKSDRIARRNGAMLPPYETQDTLDRLSQDIAAVGARTVVCLGDSFDDLAAGRDLAEPLKNTLHGMMAGRRWVWIAGNHDPGPLEYGGTHLFDFTSDPLVFRHIADADPMGEVSGHYHPKARLLVRGRMLTRRCFLVDRDRLILPAYGTYTGGLYCDRPELTALMSDAAVAILLGATPVQVPFARVGQATRPASLRAAR